MNLKKISIILVIVLTFILCISAISAVENETVTPSQGDNQKEPTKTNMSTDINTPKDNTQTQPAPKPNTRPVRTDVDADDVVVSYKKKGYFKVKVENDDTDRPVKNLKLKIKVFTKSKSKTYTIKTNSKGIAKFNTKNLKVGVHKVIVTSTDSKYKVYEKAKITVGKKSTVTLKAKQVKKLSNKDKLRVKVRYDDDDNEYKVVFKGKAKHTKLIKAKFYFKNKQTGRVIVKTDYAEYDEDTGRLEGPEEDCSWRFALQKVKVTYVTYK